MNFEELCHNTTLLDAGIVAHQWRLDSVVALDRDRFLCKVMVYGSILETVDQYIITYNADLSRWAFAQMVAAMRPKAQTVTKQLVAKLETRIAQIELAIKRVDTFVEKISASSLSKEQMKDQWNSTVSWIQEQFAPEKNENKTDGDAKIGDAEMIIPELLESSGSSGSSQSLETNTVDIVMATDDGCAKAELATLNVVDVKERIITKVQEAKKLLMTHFLASRKSLKHFEEKLATINSGGFGSIRDVEGYKRYHDEERPLELKRCESVCSFRHAVVLILSCQDKKVDLVCAWRPEQDQRIPDDLSLLSEKSEVLVGGDLQVINLRDGKRLQRYWVPLALRFIEYYEKPDCVLVLPEGVLMYRDCLRLGKKFQAWLVGYNTEFPSASTHALLGGTDEKRIPEAFLDLEKTEKLHQDIRRSGMFRSDEKEETKAKEEGEEKRRKRMEEERQVPSGYTGYLDLAKVKALVLPFTHSQETKQKGQDDDKEDKEDEHVWVRCNLQQHPVTGDLVLLPRGERSSECQATPSPQTIQVARWNPQTNAYAALETPLEFTVETDTLAESVLLADYLLQFTKKNVSIVSWPRS